MPPSGPTDGVHLSYGGLMAVPFANLGLELARFDLDEGTFGLGDIDVQPFNLGWNTEGADFITWYAFTAPVGRYAVDANDNIGLGMWSHELGLGSSLFFDDARSWHASVLGTFEMHSSPISWVKQLLSVLLKPG